MKPIQLCGLKNENPGFRFLSTPRKVLTKISHPKKVTTKFQTQKKSSDRKFQTQKRASHIPVTYIPEYPPPPWGTLHPLFVSTNSILFLYHVFIINHFETTRVWYCGLSDHQMTHRKRKQNTKQQVQIRSFPYTTNPHTKQKLLKNCFRNIPTIDLKSNIQRQNNLKC